MWYTCCMISLLLEPSIFFPGSCDLWLLLVTISCDWVMLSLTLSSKNRKMKNKLKGKWNKKENEEKTKFTFFDLDLSWGQHILYAV